MNNSLRAFFRGMGQALDIFGVLGPRRPAKRSTDVDALRSDWEKVGGYMRSATKQLKDSADNE